MVKQLIGIGGKSVGLIIDRTMLQLLGLELGAEVELGIDQREKVLTIRPASEAASKRKAEFEAARSHVLKRHGGALKKLAKR